MSHAQRLDSVAEITMGQEPQGETYNVDANGMPLIAGAGDFGEVHPAPKKYTTAPGKVCQAGDIILGIRATIGEKVLADRPYCLGRGVAGLRARPAPKELRALMIPVPPLDLQVLFSNRVGALNRIADCHRDSSVGLDALFASLQHRAFRGEL